MQKYKKIEESGVFAEIFLFRKTVNILWRYTSTYNTKLFLSLTCIARKKNFLRKNKIITFAVASRKRDGLSLAAIFGLNH